ncbi:MAG TPA: hypothetical protein VFQ67_01885 [Allosphingosinicella sp.]|jgi:hypothetical protein|nr:hypothetical protein [Allosphingosinicella sp.]
MAQVEGYDSRLATELEKLWREKILAGAAQDFRQAIAGELAAIKVAVKEAGEAQSERLRQLDNRIGKLGEIDQKLIGLIAQVDSGAQQFAIAAQQMSAIPAIAAAASELADKIGRIDGYLENFDRRANQPNNLTEISRIVGARDLDNVDKVDRIRGLLDNLRNTDRPPSKPPRFRNAKAFWQKALIPAALIAGLLVVVAALALGGLIPVNRPADRSAAVKTGGPPGKSDKQLVRDGWMALKARSPEMAKGVERNCAQSECDIVQVVASDLAKKSKTSLADEIFKVGPAFRGTGVPSCDYDTNDAVLNGARGGARPDAIQACLAAARAGEKDAETPLTARDYGAYIKAYLIAIGRAGNRAWAGGAAQGGSSASNGTLENGMTAAPANSTSPQEAVPPEPE